MSGKSRFSIELPKGVKVVSTDVFDTLLLRKVRSQTSRIAEGEQEFARLLDSSGYSVSASDLIKSRNMAQQVAYRSLAVGGNAGEVRLCDIIQWQLKILSLPDHFLEPRLAIEIAIEKNSLAANRQLADFLRRCRDDGCRTIAVSDTALSANQVETLISHFHEPGLVDRVYSSADVRASKRHAGLFHHVLEKEAIKAEELLHIGDDRTADHEVPRALGVHARHVPRSSFIRGRSLANGAVVRSGQILGEAFSPRKPAAHSGVSELFGHGIFGPIVAEFCLKIWLYAQQARADGDMPVLLFCARGGAGIREAYERVLKVLDLPGDVRRETILISRLVAARTAVERRDRAALDEIGREFEGRSFADVALALGGVDQSALPDWQTPFRASGFYDLLDSKSGARLREEIRLQNALFKRHLTELGGDATRLMLCDTGLYGSTQRLLAAGFPEYRIESIHFARSNYKGFGEEHFDKVAGLMVEQNRYDPFRIQTAVLRYWHIIESLFEPGVPSVRRFELTDDGRVATNSVDMRYPLDPHLINPLLKGALAYIDTLPGGANVMEDAAVAWRRLKRAITFPSSLDLAALEVGARSVDFGRTDAVKVIRDGDDDGLRARLTAVRANLWKEGAISRDFASLSMPLLLALEMAYALRGASGRFRPIAAAALKSKRGNS